ncbi:hypothetical protein D3C86_1170630 [compost metagenome]
MHELVHGVVEGLGGQTITGDAGLFLDLLGKGDLFSPGLRRHFRIETGLLEEVLVPIERLGREGDGHTPLRILEGNRVDDVRIIGLLFVFGHRHRNDEVVLCELLQRARTDIGHGDRSAGGSERGCLVLALRPADDFRNDLPAGILAFPFLDVFFMDGVHLVAAIDPADLLVGGVCRHRAKGSGTGKCEGAKRKSVMFQCHR